ncbi:MAG: hypothetical protein V7785_08290 [Bermanella sp.]
MNKLTRNTIALCIIWLSLMLPAFADTLTHIPETQNLREMEINRLQLVDNKTQQQQRLLWFIQASYWMIEKNAEFEQIEALDKQIEFYLKSHPTDYELMALRGSIVSFKVTYVLQNLSKVRLFGSQANRLMDRAVNAAPENLGARLQRGINSAIVPSFLRRAHYGVTDLNYLKQKLGEDIAPGFLNMVDTFLALALRNDNKQDEARTLWKTVIAKKDPVWSVQAAQYLDDM